MKITSPLFIACFFLANISLGQDFDSGFIVTQEYDSIHGWLQKMGDSQSEKICVFKETRNSKTQSYSPEQIISYGFKNGRVYVSNKLGIEINRLKPSFIRLIVDGDVPLYYYKGQYAYLAPSKTIYYLEKKDNFYRKNISAVLIKDCFELNQTANKISLSDKSLSDFFLEYHGCRGLPAKVYLDKKEKGSLEFLLGGGVSSLTANSDDARFRDLNNTTSPALSFNINARYYFASRNRLRFAPTFSYVLAKDFTTNLSEESISLSSKFDYSSLRAGLIGRYKLINLSEKFSLDAIGGGGIGYSSIKVDERFIDLINGNDIFTTPGDLEIQNLEPYATAGILVNYDTGSRVYYLEINGTKTFGTMKESEINESTYSINSLSILAGVNINLN